MSDSNLIYLPNLRARRAFMDPSSLTRHWEVQGNELSAQVKQVNKTLPRQEASVMLEVQVDLVDKPWRFINVDSRQPVRVQEVPPDLYEKKGSKTFRVYMKIPSECPVNLNREAVQLNIVYQVEGKQKRETLEIDHRCLLGDIDPSGRNNLDGRFFAQLTQKYRSDPLIKKLISKARPLPRLSLEGELERLKEWIGFDRKSHTPPDADPSSLPLGVNSVYALSPTETARLGGDCEDWSILLGAYLSELSFSNYMAVAPGHVWLRAIDKDGKVKDVDWVGHGGEPAYLWPLYSLPPIKTWGGR